MTRRNFVAMGIAASAAPVPLVVPVQEILDTATKPAPGDLHRFREKIWPEAARDFGRCGIVFQRNQVQGEVRRLPGGGPEFKGLAAGMLNLVLTPFIPIEWDQGRAVAGMTTRYDHFHVCTIALRYAHGHQIPYLSLNTCVHEILHAFMQNIFEPQPTGASASVKEFRIDALATRLWLFKDGGEVRRSAEVYLRRLQEFQPPRSSL